MKKIFLGLICIFLIFQIVSANQEDWKEPFNQSFEYLYNLEFSKAIGCLEKSLKIEPNSPAIYWRLTFALWFKAAYDESLKEKDKKELEKEFNQIFDKGITICSSDSSKPEILFYLGGLYVNRVFFKQALGQRNISMLKDVRKSRGYLEKIRKTEDFYYEACGYLGIFNYGPILMSWTQRKAANLAGYKWDEDLGLEQIRKAIKNSRYSDDIKFLYQGILVKLVIQKKRRNKIPEALYFTRELIRKYPRNSFLKNKLEVLEYLKNQT